MLFVGGSEEGPVRVGIDRLLADVRTGRFEQTLAALTAGGAVITTAEIYLAHDGSQVTWLRSSLCSTATTRRGSDHCSQ